MLILADAGAEGSEGCAASAWLALAKESGWDFSDTSKHAGSDWGLRALKRRCGAALRARGCNAIWAQCSSGTIFFLATRETGELRAETMQMGYSLARLLADIGEFESAALNGLAEVAHITFPAAFTFAVTGWHIPAQSALIAYLWSWLENQVMAAVKCVPLGQTDGQRLLARLGAHLPALAQQSLAAADDQLCNFTPALAIASSRHETQYSRLFRS